ncbi:hypothetical protein MJN85_26475, partial [Salmonella enterica subsp. enterica serovar Anatum]|nr:hypothetical protein [Salmonella enterica subsp. enterica serovar Anatum]
TICKADFGCYITLDKGWRVIDARFSGHKLGSGHLNLALKKPSAARIPDWAGAESLSGRMLLLVLLKVLYLVINQEINYGISNFNDYCSKHY